MFPVWRLIHEWRNVPREQKSCELNMNFIVWPSSEWHLEPNAVHLTIKFRVTNHVWFIFLLWRSLWFNQCSARKIWKFRYLAPSVDNFAWFINSSIFQGEASRKHSFDCRIGIRSSQQHVMNLYWTYTPFTKTTNLNLQFLK